MVFCLKGKAMVMGPPCYLQGIPKLNSCPEYSRDLSRVLGRREFLQLGGSRLQVDLRLEALGRKLEA